jgi:hypothetical protein
MAGKARLIVAVVMLGALASAVFAQRGFRGGFGPTPGQRPVGEAKEWTFARLAYDGSGYRRGSGWAVDYPGAEHHLSRAVDRLTRIDAHLAGHVVSPDYDDLFDYPWLYAVEVGSWTFSDSQARRMRDYLLRGGFLMVDDFWGTYQWAIFTESMNRVFPDRPIVEIGDAHELMHVLYDLDQRIQIPGRSYFYSGVTWQQDGYTPHWRAILDDDGRIMVAINFNMDMGDAWEHADDPYYPQPMTALAYRFGVNYLIYAMTH